MSMSDPFLPVPADGEDRPEHDAERVAQVEHEDEDRGTDVLAGPEDDEVSDEDARPSSLRRPEAGDRMTAGELESDLDG